MSLATADARQTGTSQETTQKKQLKKTFKVTKKSFLSMK
jgi:hypothetical protein